MTEQPKPRKVSSRSFIAGIALTAVAALMLIGAICWVTPKGYVDFPCFDIQQAECLNGSRILSGGDEADVSQARMFLCISIYLRGFRGGGTIARGAELSDTWSKRDIELARQGETLVVNGQSLAAGESFSRLRIFPSLTLWLFAATRTTITNRGVFDCFLDGEGHERAIDALYVYGSVSEGWFPNPLGPIALGVGIWLLIRGIRERRHARAGGRSQSTAQNTDPDS
jgi:hypothetical protein